MRHPLNRIILSAGVLLALFLASMNISNAAAAALRPADNYNIAIPRSSLGELYIISASLIPQSLAATSSGLAGKIVHFQLYHDGVDLYESTDGLVVTKDLPARRLLTTFPIVEENEDEVIIDFNKGMQRIFTAGWYSTGNYINMSRRDEALEISQSRVFSVEQKDDQLVVRQTVQARDPQYSANTETRYEVRYFIAPYMPSDFLSKEHDPVNMRYVRFFQTAAQLEDTTGRVTSKIALFNLDKPIPFYYSANTPKEYVKAIKQGVLYWNSILGKDDLITCERAPEGVTAPDSELNIIQWVPWDNAGFAYADILINPHTGESIRGQAYMTSVFAIKSISRARVLLRLMRSFEEDNADKDSPDEIHLKLWPTSSLCKVDALEYARDVADGLEDVLADPELTDEVVFKLSQFYVAHVVAHEVGHILGLRHNFGN